MVLPKCLFCAIASKEIEADIIFEDDKVVAFSDISPQAPVHFLVVPKQHIKSVAELGKADAGVVAHVFEVIADLAKKLKFADDGFRVVANTGKMAGQTVDHLHFHVLAGRELGWPPG